MSDHDFQTEVIDRLARIETQQSMMSNQIHALQEELESVKQIALEARQSSNSAHHRIDFIFWLAAALGALVSFFVTWIRGK